MLKSMLHSGYSTYRSHGHHGPAIISVETDFRNFGLDFFKVRLAARCNSVFINPGQSVFDGFTCTLSALVLDLMGCLVALPCVRR